MLNKQQIESKLETGIWAVSFIKQKDGSTRVMSCSRDWELLKTGAYNYQEPKGTASDKQAENPDVVRVWCTDVSDWRSFRVDSLQEIVEEL